MRNKEFLRIFFMLFIVMMLTNHAICLNKPTHNTLNVYIAERTINDFSLNEYLMKFLGFRKGANELLLGVQDESQ